MYRCLQRRLLRSVRRIVFVSSTPFVFGILHREMANKVFGKRPARLLSDLRHGSSSVQVRCCNTVCCAPFAQPPSSRQRRSSSRQQTLSTYAVI